MPLAECLAIVSVAPVLANLFSRWWLDEPGDAFSWMAALASFAGVLIIVRPGSGVFAYAALYPMIGAKLGLASFLTITRAVSGRDARSESHGVFRPLVAFAAFSTAMPVNWVDAAKSMADLALFFGIGVLSPPERYCRPCAYRYGRLTTSRRSVTPALGRVDRGSGGWFSGTRRTGGRWRGWRSLPRPGWRWCSGR